jgi:hypothetical protein
MQEVPMGQRVATIVGACVLAVFGFSTGEPSAAQEKKEPVPKLEWAISIWTPPTETWLHVFSDGSGIVGYGDGGNGDGQFKAGTFDVAQVTKELKALNAGSKQEDARYGFSFESERKGTEGPAYYTQDQKVIPALFKKARKASGLE